VVALADLEIVLAFDLHRPDGQEGQPFIAETLRATVAALSAANIPYAIAGVMAYGVYARAQFTRVIDILTSGDLRDEIANALLGLGFVPDVDAQSGISFRDTSACVTLAVKFAASLSEKEALRDPCRHTVFGVATLVVKQKYLAWIFCLTDQRHRVFALINEGSLDVHSVRNLMENAGDSAAMRVLAAAEAKAIKEKDSSYSKSVEARLARRRSSDLAVCRMPGGTS
jgi:hypothetical protein